MTSTVFVRSMRKVGEAFVVELTGCRMGCTKVMTECMYGCITNVGKRVSIQEIMEMAKKQSCCTIEVIGSTMQKNDLLRKYKEEIQSCK